MKILHVAMGSPEIDRAWSELGHTVHRLDWPYYVKKRGKLAFQQKLLSEASSNLYDVIFMQLQTPDVIQRETVENLRRLGAFVINWTGDVRENIDWYKNLAPSFNVTAFTNQTDIDIIRSMGYNAHYLQIGYDETIYKYKHQERKGVVFLGNNYPNRFPESSTRERIVRCYATKGLQIYGKGWSGKRNRTMPEQEVRIYQKARFALNIDHFDRPLFYSDRVLRAQACGAVICQMGKTHISEEHPYTLKGYPKEIDVFCNDVGNNGKLAAEYTREHHTWHSRFPVIEEMLNLYSE